MQDLSFPYAGEVYSLVCSVFWAVAIVLFTKSGQRVPPVALNLFKNTVAIVLFLGTMLALGLPLAPESATRADWLILLASGAAGIGLADSLLFTALNRLGAGRTAIVDSLYSPFVILCSGIFLAEPIGVGLLAALGILIAAILIGTYEPRSAALSAGPDAAGVAIGVASQLIMAAAIVAAKPVIEQSEAFWATTVRLVGGTAFLVLQCAWPTWRRGVAEVFRPSRAWATSLPATFLGTYLALVLWILGMKYTYAAVASLLNQLSVIFTLLLATFWLGEPLTRRKVVAIIMGFLAGGLAVLTSATG